MTSDPAGTRSPTTSAGHGPGGTSNRPPAPGAESPNSPAVRIAPAVVRFSAAGASGVGEDLFLLDFHGDRFYRLNPSADELLMGLTRFSRASTLARAVDAYGVPADRLSGDLDRLVSDLQRLRLIVPAKPPWHASARAALRRNASRAVARVVRGTLELLRPTPGRPSALAAHIWLVWASLRLIGWSATLEAWTPADGRSRPRGAADVASVDRAVREAFARCVLPVDCKHRAILVFHLVRSVLGRPAVLVVGVDPAPFRCHAWTVCDGVPVADDPEYCQLFRPVAWFPGGTPTPHDEGG